MKRFSAKIITAWPIVGTLDILSAFIYSFIRTGKNNAAGILRYIASAIFGQEALKGGTAMVLAGLLLHYLIALSFTLFFFWLYPKVNFFRRNRLLTGILYGLFIW